LNLNNQEVIPIEELHSDERYKLKTPMTNNIPIEDQYKRTSIFERKCELSSSRFKRFNTVPKSTT
jgi:hypothetical protein